MPLKVPALTYHQLVGVANKTSVAHHPAQTIPVPIEDIIDLGYRIDVVPIEGLEERFKIVAYITHDLREIRVDKYVFSHQPYRLNFSLAHELGHLILHSDIYKQMSFKTPENWKAALMSIPNDTYMTMEYQADKFAGTLLVPPPILAQRFQELMDAVEKQFGKRFLDLDNLAQNYTIKGLAKEFTVSTGAIWTCLRDQKLI